MKRGKKPNVKHWKDAIKLLEMSKSAAMLQPVKLAKCVKRRSRLVLRVVLALLMVEECDLIFQKHLAGIVVNL